MAHCIGKITGREARKIGRKAMTEATLVVTWDKRQVDRGIWGFARWRQIVGFTLIWLATKAFGCQFEKKTIESD